jgi:hypothetical protein
MAQVMNGYRHAWIRAGGVVLLAVVVGALSVIVLVAHTAPIATLEDQIPDEPGLLAAGLDGVPAPQQPSSPLQVDRVVVDALHTYVTYHYTVDPGRGFVPLPILSLYDDHGNLVSAAGEVRCERTGTPWTLPAWLPWRPTATIRCLDREDTPMPLTARAAEVELDPQLAPAILPGFPAPPHIEAVRVPLTLTNLAREHVMQPGIIAASQALTLTMASVTNGPAFSELIFTFQPPVQRIAQATLQVGSGAHIPIQLQNPICDEGACTQVGAFPAQGHGAHAAALVSKISVGGGEAVGVWQFGFTMP